MSGDRPPGGTARHEGKPAHRRVQWLDNIRRSSFRSDRSSHALDEHGLNPEAFQSLTQALERHRSVSPEIQEQPLQSSLPQQPEPLHVNTHATRHSRQPSAFSTSTSNTVSTDFTPDSSGNASPIDHVPNHMIQEGERSGLPGTADLERFSQKRASQVVRSHTQKGRKGLSALRKNKRSKAHDMEASRLNDGNHTDTDVEKSSFDSRGYEPTLPPGSGILSALLSLYDNRYPHSGASTPARSHSPEHDRQSRSRLPAFSPGAMKHKKERRARSKQRNVDFTAPKQASDTPPVSSNLEERKTGLSSRRAQAPLSLLGMSDRPPQSCTGGGVLGPLIATTGNIMGAAAPRANTLGPDIERPGYHLSR
jgi:hypothetical protein